MLSVKQLLKKYDIRPKKRLSQSFLVDPNITRKIASLLGASPADNVVEIGSGLGILTGLIAPHVKSITALEIDPALAQVLKAELSAPNVRVVHDDFLEYDLHEAARQAGAPLKIIGNAPYNISSAIIFRLIDYRQDISAAVLMFQKEVADRIAAGPSSKEYGIISVVVSMYAAVRREFIVPPGCFFPRPKVDSAVIRMEFREKPLVDLTDPGLFRELVRTAFARRRKTLLNNLKDSRLNISGNIEQVLQEAGIDGKRRAETLTPEEFGKLSNLLAKG